MYPEITRISFQIKRYLSRDINNLLFSKPVRLYNNQQPYHNKHATVLGRNCDKELYNVCAA